MTGAFGGDPATKAALLERLARHAADGTLIFGATAWDGERGTPLGVSTQGGDSDDYAERYGYPLALAGMLDPMTAHADPDGAIDTAISWVACVEVGADLSRVPERVIDDVLRAMAADRLAAPFYVDLGELFRAEAAGARLERRVWTDLRDRIDRHAQAERPDSDVRAALMACATACWPIRTSSSILATLVTVWLNDTQRHPDPEFGDALRDRAGAVLETIYRETQPQRDVGDSVDIPALFRARTPTLAAAFEAHLTRANTRFRDRSGQVPRLILRQLAGTGA